jgi:hypothetical protein
MDEVKLKRLKRKLEGMRQRVANLRSRELIGLAEALGRTRSNRGKEPTYVSSLLPNSKPISIPDHPGSLNKYTAGNILDSLEQDIFNLEELLDNKGVPYG